MKKKDTKWKNYEEVAAFVLNDIREEFGIDEFEGKQSIEGERSGTTWEIDGKGVCEDEEIFFLVECRRFTKSRQSQERIGALAYRILDTGAAGGFIVSPLGLQEGAKKVAEKEKIHTIHLDANSTKDLYVATFLKEIRIGIRETFDLSKSVTEKVSIFYTDKDGNHITPEQMEKLRGNRTDK
jgi:hypothetical protein